GHDRVGSTVQALDAVDGDGIGAVTLDLRAHGDQAFRQVHHFRLARGVLDHGLAAGQGGRHEDILGTGHTHGIEEVVRATQAAFRRAGLDIAAFHGDLGAHGLETADVQIHRPRADGAAAGQGHFGVAEMRDHGSQHQNGGAHGFHQLVGRDQGGDAGRVHFDVELVAHHRLYTHATEQLDHGGNVVQVRQVADSD